MKNLNIKAFGGLLYLFIVVSASLFLAAWTLDYWQAWVFLAVFFVSVTVIFIYLAKNDPNLLARRLNTVEQEKGQKIIQFMIQLSFLTVLIFPAIDHRFRLSAAPWYAVIAGDVLVVLSLLIIFLVFKENTFTATTIQVEAGQKVVSTGPYALVRHPMYAGALFLFLGIPLALGSWWGLLIIFPFASVLVWRILNEEKFLVKNLSGYAKYRNEVKYRLIPFIW
jgi:protein-S-isoprenylcysteine O-methyltransferase Ste14